MSLRGFPCEYPPGTGKPGTWGAPMVAGDIPGGGCQGVRSRGLCTRGGCRDAPPPRPGDKVSPCHRVGRAGSAAPERWGTPQVPRNPPMPPEPPSVPSPLGSPASGVTPSPPIPPRGEQGGAQRSRRAAASPLTLIPIDPLRAAGSMAVKSMCHRVPPRHPPVPLPSLWDVLGVPPSGPGQRRRCQSGSG